MTAIDLAIVVEVVADVYGLPAATLREAGLRGDGRRARQVVAWAARTFTGSTWPQIGAVLSINQEAARKACGAAVRLVGTDLRVDEVRRRLKAIREGGDTSPPAALPRPAVLALGRLRTAAATLERERYGARERASVDELIAAAKAAVNTFQKGLKP